MKSAIVSDRLTVFGGAERVLLEINKTISAQKTYVPFATIPTGPGTPFEHLNLEFSAANKLPFLRKFGKLLLPLEPLIIEQFDLRDYKLIVSSSHAVAKGCITGPDQLHISMVYSPMRYAWDLQSQYLSEMGCARGPKSWVVRPLLSRLRVWDAASASRPDHVIAISNFVAGRVRKFWGRSSYVIYPPVDVENIVLQELKNELLLHSFKNGAL